MTSTDHSHEAVRAEPGFFETLKLESAARSAAENWFQDERSLRGAGDLLFDPNCFRIEIALRAIEVERGESDATFVCVGGGACRCGGAGGGVCLVGWCLRRGGPPR